MNIHLYLPYFIIAYMMMLRWNLLKQKKSFKVSKDSKKLPISGLHKSKPVKIQSLDPEMVKTERDNKK